VNRRTGDRPSTQLSEAIKDRKPKFPVPIMILNGTKDPLVPYDGGHIRILGGRSRGKILSTDETVRLFRKYNGCEAKPAVRTLPDRDPNDGCRVTVTTYGGGRAGSEVRLVKVSGGGHTWPGGTQYLPAWLVGKVGRDVDGSKMAVDFENDDDFDGFAIQRFGANVALTVKF
jgi:polyhydroxybutyrate depolymerase